MSTSKSVIRVNVDPTNPGQFFACCGLLELADRLWHGAEGCFSSCCTEFTVTCTDAPNASRVGSFLEVLAECPLTSSMSDADVGRLEVLKSQRASALNANAKQEKKTLEKLWRESPLVLHAPFDIRLDWFLDSWSGGSRFKTWAGQQSVIDIAQGMKRSIEQGRYDDVPPEKWLDHVSGSGVSFNFDSDCGVQSSALDVGFVLDPLGMSSATRPFLELLAFVGLQRFRPTADARNNSHCYTAWAIPLLPAAAAAFVAGGASCPECRRFSFALLYRTKYLKSFLPANQ